MNVPDWKSVEFDDVVTSRGSGKAGLPQKEWLNDGDFPVIGQGDGEVEGWTNRSDLVVTPNPALVLYGGHTRRTKFVDQPFVPGPNVKILQPATGLSPSFLFYFLQWLPIPSKGYADHFPLVRRSRIQFPSLPDQQRIVAILDEAFASIAIAKANVKNGLRNAGEVFDCYMQSVFSLDCDGVVLGEVFETVTGTTPPKSNSHYYGGFMPFVKPPELCDGELDSAADGLTEAGANIARTLPPNSVLVSCIGNLGKVGLNTIPVAFNQQINAILPDATRVVPRFMFFQALSRLFKDQLENLASGTTVPIVNKSKFNSIRVALPSLPEQELIVGRIGALRKEIAHVQSLYARKLSALDELKQSLLHQAFSGQL